jgi:hypothetical protein
MNNQRRRSTHIPRYAAALFQFASASPYASEQLADRLAHARVTGPHSPGEHDVAGQPATFAAPSQAEQALMASLGVQFDGRSFLFAGFRYARLADALNDARRARGPD